MEKDKVSIITPMYNTEKFIAEAIESVLAQTYENWELLIMNDRSEDASYEIAKGYADKDSRIRITSAEQNAGVVKGRNMLTDMAQGEYIAFLDSDDYWERTKLERQISFMKEKKADISCTGYTRVNEEGRPLNEIKIQEVITYKDLLKNNYMGCLTVVYNAGKLGKKYFKERKKNEDYVLWLEIVKKTGKVYGLEENLAYYRVLDNSRSSNKIDAAKDRWGIYREVEKLSFINSVYYFINYIVKALKKTR